MSQSDSRTMITRNKTAYRNYFVDNEYEAGVILVKSEVESLREGRIELNDGYAKFDEGELFLRETRIPVPRDTAPDAGHDPERRRKLLLRRKQLNRLETKVEQSGYTLIPLEMYFKEDHVKVTLGLCKGKKQFDKQAEDERRTKARKMARDHARHLEQLEHVYDEHT